MKSLFRLQLFSTYIYETFVHIETTCCEIMQENMNTTSKMKSTHIERHDDGLVH